jgi:prophage antirepressor-like protein
MQEIVKVFNEKMVRIMDKDGEPWFVAKDVCDVLELKNPTVAVQSLDDDEVTKLNLGGLHGEANIVNESGLYHLIFKSRKKKAQEFRRWVTAEVLPSIRKTGAYLSPAMTDSQIQSLLTTLEQEMYRRINAEGRLQLLEKQLKKLAKRALPKGTFGELSKKTGLPKDKLVAPYIRSDRRPHRPQLLEYFQLLLPLYFSDEVFSEVQAVLPA